MNICFQMDETFNYGLKQQYAHILAIAFLTFTLHLIDRQTDYMNRLDYLTAEKLKASRSRANDLHMINKELLNNILPRHVGKVLTFFVHEQFIQLSVLNCSFKIFGFGS